jgi:hypothetical protein
MSETPAPSATDQSDSHNFRPNFELPFRLRAFAELQKLAPALRAKHQANLRESNLPEEIDPNWNHIPFKDDSPRTELLLPTIGSDSAAPFYVNLPDDDDPLMQIGLRVFSDGSPYIADGDDVEGLSSYDAFFGSELAPFIVHGNAIDIDPKQPLGEQVAAIPNKRKLTDQECEDIVRLIASNLDNTSSGLYADNL